MTSMTRYFPLTNDLHLSVVEGRGVSDSFDKAFTHGQLARNFCVTRDVTAQTLTPLGAEKHWTLAVDDGRVADSLLAHVEPEHRRALQTKGVLMFCRKQRPVVRCSCTTRLNLRVILHNSTQIVSCLHNAQNCTLFAIRLIRAKLLSTRNSN